MQKLLLTTAFLFLLICSAHSQTVFVNEVKYLAEDPMEKGIELVNLNDTNLTGWEIILYNSSGVPYGSFPLNGAAFNSPSPEQSNVIIFVDIMMLSSNNGSGLVLKDANDHIVQYLSYGGQQLGNEGPAEGMTSINIGTQNGDNTPQLTGIGYELNNFAWNVNTPSLGDINLGQTFTTAPSSAGFLPVEWVSFNATTQKTGILLEWVTGTEYDNDHFILERSTDGRTFEVMERIQSKGTSSSAQHYQWLDQKAARGINYYRISQMDFNGDTDTYKVIQAQLEANVQLHIYPNPAVNDIVLDLPITDEFINIEIYDVSGKLVLQQFTPAGNGLLHLNVATLLSGHYILVVKTENSVFSHSLIKK